jgi:hypothetical protein
MVSLKVFRGNEMTSMIFKRVLSQQKSFVTIGQFGVGPVLKRDNFILFLIAERRSSDILWHNSLENRNDSKALIQCTMYESYQIINYKMQVRVHNAVAAA